MLILLMACCDNLRRRVPLNFIALGLFVSGGIGDVPAVLGHIFNLPTLSLSASPFRLWWRGRCWAPWQCACSFLPRIRFFSGRPLNRFPQSQPRLDPPASVILAGGQSPMQPPIHFNGAAQLARAPKMSQHFGNGSQVIEHARLGRFPSGLCNSRRQKEMRHSMHESLLIVPLLFGARSSTRVNSLGLHPRRFLFLAAPSP